MVLRNIILPLSGSLAFMAIPCAVIAHNSVVVIPLAGDDTPTSKVVFVTESKWTGNLGGSTGADQKCMDESLIPGSKVKGREFRAFIGGASFPSDFQVGTRSFTRSHLPYKTVTGVKVADDYADLMSGSLNAPINVSQTGSTVSTGVWTGIRTDGFDDFDVNETCAGFNVGTTFLGISGHSTSTGYNWTGADVTGAGRSYRHCSLEAALYCFEQ